MCASSGEPIGIGILFECVEEMYDVLRFYYVKTPQEALTQTVVHVATMQMLMCKFKFAESKVLTYLL